MITGPTALGSNANVGDSRVLRTEIAGKNIDFADCLQRWLTLRRLAKNSSVRSLSIQRETGAVALRANKFEVAVGVRLRNVGVQVQKRIDVAAVARQFDYGLIVDRLTDGLV